MLCPRSEKEEAMKKATQTQLKLFVSADGAVSMLRCCMMGNPPPPPPLCMAWVIVPAARQDAGHATAEDKLLEVFDQTPQLWGCQVLQGTGPSSSSFYLSVALAFPGFGLSCSWCCRDVCFELFLVLRGFSCSCT